MTEERTEEEEQVEGTGRENEEAEEHTNDMDQISQAPPPKSLMEKQVMYAAADMMTCFLHSGLYFVSLDLPTLSISVFPKESRNVLTISLCLAWDTFILSLLVAWEIYAMFVITSVVLSLTDTVDMVMKRLSIRSGER